MAFAVEINPTTFPAAKFGDISSIMNNIIPVLTAIGALLFFVMGFIGAYTMVTAGGDPERMAKAQRTFKFAVVGLVVVLGAYAFVKFITAILKVDKGIIPL